MKNVFMSLLVLVSASSFAGSLNDFAGDYSLQSISLGKYSLPQSLPECTSSLTITYDRRKSVIRGFFNESSNGEGFEFRKINFGKKREFSGVRKTTFNEYTMMLAESYRASHFDFWFLPEAYQTLKKIYFTSNNNLIFEVIDDGGASNMECTYVKK